MLLFPFLISIAWRLLLTEGLVSFAIAFTYVRACVHFMLKNEHIMLGLPIFKLGTILPFI
jgi:hypothetical protein